MSKPINKAVAAFDKLFGSTLHWLTRHSPTRLRNHEVETKPGEMLTYLSPEDREAIQNLKSDDLAADKVSEETAKMAAEESGYYDWRYYTNMLKEAKLQFDAKITKPTERKKY